MKEKIYKYTKFYEDGTVKNMYDKPIKISTIFDYKGIPRKVVRVRTENGKRENVTYYRIMYKLFANDPEFLENERRWAIVNTREDEKFKLKNLKKIPIAECTSIGKNKKEKGIKNDGFIKHIQDGKR